MYCPKCGTENAETNKYCRACREDLRVVSQAMKQRLPVMLASKFDRMLDSRSERFRRDSVFCVLASLILLVVELSDSSGKLNALWVLLSPTLFLFGVFDYLAYRRSLAPDFDWGTSSEEAEAAERFDKSGVVTLGIVGSHTEDCAGAADEKYSQSS